jgi:shikimate kinase
MKIIDPKRSRRIYLTGFMGSGKSTIGPILANTLGYAFVDVDKAIEKLTGQSVREIFADSGEPRFRELEHQLLQDIQSSEHIVISLGGGTIADPLNFPLIKASGILVYLKSTPDHLFRRLHYKTDRPVLVDANGERLSDEALRVRIEDLYARRERYYEQADIIIPTDEHKVGVTVDQIVKKLSGLVD